jgi:hypothetical protein
MLRRSFKFVISALLCFAMILMTACDATNPAVVDDTPAINVQGTVTVSGGTVNATVPNPLPINGVVSVSGITGVTVNEGGLPTTPYYYRIADGDVSGHVPWSIIGYNGATGTTEADCWSYGAVQPIYVFPTAAAGMEILSSDNTQDIGTSIFSGNSTGGSTILIVDITKDFTAGTPVAIGDCIILDKSGTTPEWGYVSGITTATTLAVSGGFSSGGTGSGRTYSILDKSAYTGAQAVIVEYLNGSYVTDTEIVILNGTTVIPTVQTDLFRINSFRVIAVGTGGKPVGNITMRNLADTPVYSYITLGFTKARNATYTVPLGKTLFVTSGTFGWAYASNSTHYARLYTQANVDNITRFQANGVFYPFTEVVCSNATVVREWEIPTKLPAKTDIRVKVFSDFTGIAEVTLRGWLE